MMQVCRRALGLVVFGMTAAALGGCAVKFSSRSPWDIQQLEALSSQLEQVRSLAQLKADEAEQLRQAKAALEGRLSSQIASNDVSIGFDDRGLVVRVLDQILFDSGKAALKQEAYPVLDQVANVLNQELAGQAVGVEGHTDNEPIKRSGWKDNWELSLARARSVLTYLVSERGVDPGRVGATGFGEYRPLASNGSATGRRTNRRVEIVVLPQRLAKSHETSAPTASSDSSEPAASEYSK